MADFSTVLKGTRFNYSYRCCEKFIFYLKLWQTDVTTIDFILLSHKYSNLFNLQAFLFSLGLISVVQLIQAQIKKKIVKFQPENNG